MANQYDFDLYQMKAELCKTFSDAKRLIIINELSRGEKTVNELAKILDIPQATVSRHLAILRQKDVVSTRHQRTNVFYSLSDPKIGEACELVNQVVLNQMQRSRELAEKVLQS